MKKFKIIRVVNGKQTFTEQSGLSKEQAVREAQKANNKKEPNTKYVVSPQ